MTTALVNQHYDTEWNFGEYAGGRWPCTAILKPNPHPEDWEMQNHDFCETAKFMRQRNAELDHLVDDLTDAEDTWWGIQRHADALNKISTISVHTGAKDHGSFSVARISELYKFYPSAALIIVVPVPGLSTVSDRELRSALRPVDERTRKAVLRRISREKAQACCWQQWPTEYAAPKALAFSFALSADPFGDDPALHDYARLLIRASLEWMKVNGCDRRETHPALRVA